MSLTPWQIPRAWEGQTAVLIGGGPSLTREQIAAIPRWSCRLLGINDAYLLAPWMDLHYACDAKWWGWHYDRCREALSCDSVTMFQRKFGEGISAEYEKAAAKYPDLKWVEGRARPGLSYDQAAIHTGKNSGYQAINLAVLLGAKKILLLGYDLKASSDGRAHWFGDHPDNVRSWYETWHPQFETLVEPLKGLGVEVINCSPDSALECFQKADIREAAAA